MKNSEIGVVLPVCSPNQLERLDRSLLSLAGQILRPEQIYVVCNSQAMELVERITTSYQEYGLVVQVYPSDSEKLASLLTIGLTKAREKYIAFLQDGDLLYSTGYQSLKQKMDSHDSVALALSEVVWFEGEVYNETDYKLGRRTKSISKEKSWLEYYSYCFFGSCLINRNHCKSGEWHFDSTLPGSLIFADFLARNGHLTKKNTENYNIPVGEKWVAKADKVYPTLSELGEAYEKKWNEVIAEKDFQNFSTKRRKKKKIRLIDKVLHTLKYLRYRIFKV